MDSVCNGHQTMQVKVNEDEDTKDNDNEALRRLSKAAMKTRNYAWAGLTS
jgi:hypothetical protein